MSCSRFQVQQKSLDIQTAAESAQLAIRGDHAMAWHNHRQRIAPIRRAHRPYGARRTDAPGDIGIAAGLAIGNGLQLAPDSPLEFRAPGLERQREVAQAAGEVGAKLAERFLDERMRRSWT